MLSDFTQNTQILKDLKGFLEPSKVVGVQADRWLASWEGARQARPATGQVLLYPQNLKDLRHILNYARQKVLRVGLEGLGESFGQQPMDLLLDLKAFNEINLIDSSQGLFEAQAGVLLEKLQSHLRAQGWEVPWSPGPWGSETLGGALAKGLIGASQRERKRFEEFQVLLASGKSLSFSPQKDPRRTRYFLGGWASLGIFTRLSFRAYKINRSPTYSFQFSNFNRAFEVIQILSTEPGLCLWLEDSLAALVRRLWEVDWREFLLLKKLSPLLSSFLPELAKPLVWGSSWGKAFLNRLPYPVSLRLSYLGEKDRTTQEKAEGWLREKGALFLGEKPPAPSLKFMERPFRALGFGTLKASFVLAWDQALSFKNDLLNHLQDHGVAWIGLKPYSEQRVELKCFYLGKKNPEELEALGEWLLKLSEKKGAKLLACSGLSPWTLLKAAWRDSWPVFKQVKSKLDSEGLLGGFF